MMKFILFLIFMFFIFNLINKKLFNLFYYNLILFSIVMLLMTYPLNNLNFWMKIYYIMGCDFYSLGLILLSLWIIGLMILVSEENFLKNNYYLFFNMINFMLIFLVMCFMMMNLIMFYIMFESSLIPIFLLIMGWGFQVDRIQAGFYMMLYTLFGSMPLFIMIIYIYQKEMSMIMDFININLLKWYMYMLLIIGFLVKMPMYFLHLWLPKAHVEAPLIGSMILAGVMLKLGSYGLMRFMMMMMSVCMNFNKFIMVISLMGGIYSSLICLCQIDMKMLVAYSSVVHMSILMSGLMTLFNWGFLGGFLMMISHGLCSSGLFCLVNINYERFFSRSLLINKGMINYFPSLSMLWFMLCSSNMSFPPSLNLFSEIMLFNSLISWSLSLIFLLMMISFFSSFYTLYLFSQSQYGNFSLNYFVKGVVFKEYYLLLMHWIPLNYLFVVMYIYV